MGFDLSGMNPNLTRPEPELPPMTERTDDDWAAYSKWQDENSGVYFRNNVWGWKRLWNFVTKVCDDILTEKDIEGGCFNDGHRISKTKANRIAKRLHKMIKKGDVKAYEFARNRHLDSLEQVDCDLCESSGYRKEPPEAGAGTYMKCNACKGTGKVDDFNKNYPFDEENVRQFANFCANSGGFEIC